MSGKKSLPTQAIGKALVEEDIYPCVVLLQCQTQGTEPLGDEPSGLGPCPPGGHGGCSPLRKRGTYSGLRVCLSNSHLREKRCIQTRRTLINTLAQVCLRNLEKKPLKYIRHADERELLCHESVPETRQCQGDGRGEPSVSLRGNPSSTTASRVWASPGSAYSAWRARGWGAPVLSQQARDRQAFPALTRRSPLASREGVPLSRWGQFQGITELFCANTYLITL